MKTRDDRSLENQREQEHYNRVDSFDEVQAELDAEADKIMSEFGSETKHERESLTVEAQQILKSYVAAHSKLTEKKRAYDLAMWILRSKKK